MSMNSFRERLVSTMDTALSLDFPTIGVQWENHKMNGQPDATWLDINIHDSMDTERMQMGSKHAVRKFGIVEVIVNVVESTGTKELFDVIAYIDKLLSEQHWVLSDGDKVVFRNMIVKHHGLVDGYYYHRLIFSYYRSECAV